MHTGRAGMEQLGREVWCIQVGQVWNCLVERYGGYR